MKIFLLLTILILTSCKLNGTDTGNPAVPDLSAGMDYPAESYYIVKAICEKVAQCNPTASISNCIQDNATSFAFGEKLGLPLDQQIWTLSEIIFYETQNIIEPDTVNSNLCKDDITVLSCSEPLLMNSYDETSEKPYSKLPETLPASCGLVF